MPTAEWQAVVRLWATSRGLDPRTLQPGRDLVLDVAREHGDELPFGVLLDDHLPAAARDQIDREAIERLAAWREWRDCELTADGVCLPQIWELELLAEVFLPETRIASGLRSAFAGGGGHRLESEGLDGERLACLRTVLEPLGIELAALGEPAPSPHYPGVLASPWRIPLARRAAKAAVDATGVPQCVRGDVYVLPYWHLRPVFERLSTGGDGLSAVLSPLAPPFADVRRLLRCARRAGWVGHPGTVARRRSRRQLEVLLTGLRADRAELDPLSRLLDLRAIAMLEQRAGDTIAIVRRLRAAFASPRLKIAVLGFDTPPDARAVVQAARDAGVPTLVVQHGLHAEPNSPDKMLADAVAVWSERDGRDVAARTSSFVQVTGNPGVPSPAEPTLRSKKLGGTGRTLVLVDYASRLSTRVDQRVGLRHVNSALRALATTRPGTVAIVRPHPAEHEPEIFARHAARYPELAVRVDTQSPIVELIEAADLCIGAISTATLQAGAASVPVVFLNVSGRRGPWPLDGSTDVPIASSSEELTELIPQVLSSGLVPGRTELVEALGVRADATDRVISLIGRLADQGSELRG
jgi:hypothetical protein